MKKLPIGIQSFTKLIENDCIYVDKTKTIHQLLTSGVNVFFLSRPRRFGKSLLISTLEALFRGRKNLFEGLYIYDKWDWTRQHPVIRIDWTRINHKTPAEIENDLSAVLRLKAGDAGIVLTREYASGRFDELIEQLYRKTGKRVVVLIDEYDVPILDVMGKSSEELKAMQETLHNIYKVLKGADDYLQFVFLTGVSKFAGLSIFSALNNIEDITLSKGYATLCGVTQEELENDFPEHLAAAAEELSITRDALLDNIRKWYNGYSWDGKTSVYNPFSTLQFLKEKAFKSYWFRTGTPTFLIKLLKQRNDIEQFLQPVQAKEAIFSSYDPERLESVPLLFQTGYLTIREITKGEDYSLVYRLEPPNREVREAFIEHLVQAYTDLEMNEMFRLHNDMQRQIKTGDSEGLERSLRAMLAHVPYQLHIGEEKYYHSLLLVWLYFMGFKAQGEVSTNIGRIDAVWELPEMTVVAEVKYSAAQPLEKLLSEAMSQIHDRKYYEAYAGKKVVLLAVAFAGREIGCKIVING
jgi:DNA-binding Lrp family transcriptional regulator